MNVTVRMTLDGMIRALRWQAHRLAEDADRGYVGNASRGERQRLPDVRTMRREDGDDDRFGD